MKYKIIIIVVVLCFCTANRSYVKQTNNLLRNFILVTASCYRANTGECDTTPFITANGSHIDTTRIDKLRWVAISRDLEKQFKMNDTILVSGIGKKYDGYWIVKDRMNKRFENKIDFLISNKKQAGLFKKVKIYLD